MPTFLVTMEDPDGAWGWRDPETGEPTRQLSWTVEAKDADVAKAFAEQQNPGLTATSAKKT
jgi:hypothetical protein